MAPRSNNLGMSSLANTDLEHILGRQLIERNKSFKWRIAPRHVLAGGAQKTAVDFFKVLLAGGGVIDLLAPIIAHWRCFPPSPVGLLPARSLLVVARQLSRGA